MVFPGQRSVSNLAMAKVSAKCNAAKIIKIKCTTDHVTTTADSANEM